MEAIKFDPFWENDWPIKVESEPTQLQAEIQPEYVARPKPVCFPEVEVRFDPFWQNDWPVTDAIETKLPKSKLVEETIEEDPEKFIISTQVAEFHRDEIRILVDNRSLRVACEHEAYQPQQREENGAPRLCSLYEEFSLPESVDESNVWAKVHDGWLSVEIPKRTSEAFDVRVN